MNKLDRHRIRLVKDKMSPLWQVTLFVVKGQAPQTYTAGLRQPANRVISRDRCR